MTESLAFDLRFALRTLGRDPIFTLIGVVTLALGLGANIAILSLTFSVLFKNLPYENPEDIHIVWRGTDRSEDLSSLSIPAFFDLEQRSRVFDTLAMFRPVHHNLRIGDSDPIHVGGLSVSWEFTSVLGIRPHRGRVFTADDDRVNAAKTVLISHELWQTRMGGDPDIVDRVIFLDGEPFTVIGVLPQGLSHERLGWSALGDFWLPIETFRDTYPFEQREMRPSLLAVGRLGEGKTAETMREDLDRIAGELASEHPLTEEGSTFATTLLRENVTGEDRRTVLLLQAAAILVWLVASVNLTSLLLTRFAARRHELATRKALGATARQLYRQLLAECLVLSLLGGLGGLVAAIGLLKSLPRFLSTLENVSISPFDPAIVGLTLASSLSTCLLVGMIPAWNASRFHLARALGSLRSRTSRRQRGLRHGLVVLELALAFTALVGAGLLVSSLAKMRSQELGFSTEKILTASFVLPQWKWEDSSAWAGFFDQALQQLEAVPEFENVAVTSSRPLSGVDRGSIVAAGDRPLPSIPDLPTTSYQMVSSEYFQVMGIPLLQGRGFQSGDDDRREAERVVVISQSLAQEFWPSESPIDQNIAFEFEGNPNEPYPQFRRVVGVVGDVRMKRLTEAPEHAVYIPYGQRSLWFKRSPTMFLVLETQGEPGTQIAPLEAALDRVDPQQPLIDTMTMQEVVETQLEVSRMLAFLLTLFATLALILAAVGVYGVVAHTVTIRTHEIGIRMALGANRGKVVFDIFRLTFLQVICGLALGLAFAFSLRKLIANHVYDIQPTDPQNLLGAALILFFLAALASLLPAMRASRTQPAEALRYD